MNEENNQNIPILGSGEEGGGAIPVPTYSSGTYKIKFSDEYYEVSQQSGRLILFQDDLGNVYMTGYIHDDYAVKEIISHLPCNFMDLNFIEKSLSSEGHVARLGLSQLPPEYGLLNLSDVETVALDSEWYALLYGEDSNKVLRTLAKGQSDITRHESLNKKELTPQYKVLSEEEEQSNSLENE